MTPPAVAEKGEKTTSKSDEIDPSLRKQLLLLTFIRCLRTALLAPPPILVPFYQNSCALESSAILWLGSWYSALAAICEMPSGVISDILGRRFTLQLAFVGLGTCWIVTYASSISSSAVIWLGLAQLLRAIGSSLYSGTDMALLYELLKKYNQRPKHSKANGKSDNDLVLKFESRQVVLSTITEAVVSAFGGLFARSFGESIVVLMSAVPFLGGAMVCVGLEETTLTTTDEAKKEVEISSSNGNNDKWQDVSNQQEASPPPIPEKTKLIRRRSSRIVTTLNEPSLRIIFGVGVVLNCATYVASTALNPLLWQQVGITNFAGGFLQATNSGMTALGAVMAPTIKGYCSRLSLNSNSSGTQELLFALLSTSSVAYGLMTWNAFSSTTPTSPSSIHTVSTIGASWLLSLVRGLAWPVLGSALNAAIGDNGTRATVLSLFAGAIKLGMVFTGFVLGYMLHQSSSLGNACALCGGLLLSAALCCLVLFPCPTKSESADRHENQMNDDSVKKDQ